jgi:holliday junction DNA helicase RuvA
MISYLNGKIIIKKEKFIVIDVGGVGYQVFLSKKSIDKLLGIGSDIKLFCFHEIKETANNLYGFFDEKQLEFFEILNDIRGIGPKVALEISSLGSLDEIKDKILSQDGNIFAGIPGIGKKRAMTIMVELTGKIKESLASAQKITGKKGAGAKDDAEDALVNLGFPRSRVKEALSQISKDMVETEQRVKQGLNMLTK